MGTVGVACYRAYLHSLTRRRHEIGTTMVTSMMTRKGTKTKKPANLQLSGSRTRTNRPAESAYPLIPSVNADIRAQQPGAKSRLGQCGNKYLFDDLGSGH